MKAFARSAMHFVRKVGEKGPAIRKMEGCTWAGPRRQARCGV